MTFVTTGLAIAGLCAVAIPIIIHLLFRRRRKPIEWAAMRFLIEAFRRQKRRLQIEQILLLVVRCLIVALLGAALAQPLLRHAGILAGGNRSVYLVIDNGLASGVRDQKDRTALQRQVDEAVAIVKALNDQGDSVGIITAAQPARALVIPPSPDLGAVTRLLESLEPAQTPSDLPGALAQLRAALEQRDRGDGQAVAYLLSEFRAGSARLESPLPENALEVGPDVKLLAAPAASEPVENVQVIAIDPVRSVIVGGGDEGATQVTVRLARNGGELGRAVSRVRLSGDGLPPIEPRQVNWEPGQSRADVDFMVDMTAASKGGSSADRSATLTASVDDDALRADDRRFEVVQLRDAVQVALIDRRSFGATASLDQLSAGNWIARALAPAERGPIQVTEVDPASLDAADLRTVDAAVLPRPDLLTDTGWSALREFVRGGGVAVIMPPSEVNVHQWTDRLARELELPWRINLEATSSEAGMALDAEQPPSELLRLISNDLRELAQPIVVRKWLGVDSAATSADRALLLADGSPLVISSSPQAERETASGNGRGAPSGAQPTNGASTAAGLVVYLGVAPDLSWTNLPSQPLMVPLLHEIIRQGMSLTRSSRLVTAGDRTSLASMGLGRAAARLRDDQGDVIALNPDGRPEQVLAESGLLAVLDPAGQKIGTLAVNVRPEAARTDVQPQAAVTNWLRRSGPWETFTIGSAATAVAATADSSGPLAGYLLLAVLALIILETALARWFSHATPPAKQQSLVGALRATIAAQPPSTAQGL